MGALLPLLFCIPRIYYFNFILQSGPSQKSGQAYPLKI